MINLLHYIHIFQGSPVFEAYYCNLNAFPFDCHMIWQKRLLALALQEK